MKFQRSSAFLQAGRDAEQGLRYFRGLAAMCGESSSYSRDSETAANKRREMMKHEIWMRDRRKNNFKTCFKRQCFGIIRTLSAKVA